MFDVLVQGDGFEKSAKVADRVATMLGKGSDRKALGAQLKAQFASSASIEVCLSGSDVLSLAKQKGLLSIIPNADVRSEGNYNIQKWDDSVGASWFWSSPQMLAPAARSKG